MCRASIQPAGSARGEASWKESGDGDDDTQVTSRTRRHHGDARPRARIDGAQMQCNWVGAWEGPTPLVCPDTVQSCVRTGSPIRVGRHASALPYSLPLGPGTGVLHSSSADSGTTVLGGGRGIRRRESLLMMATVPVARSLMRPRGTKVAETFLHHGKAKVTVPLISIWGSSPTSPRCPIDGASICAASGD